VGNDGKEFVLGGVEFAQAGLTSLRYSTLSPSRLRSNVSDDLLGVGQVWIIGKRLISGLQDKFKM
jgi:hypothetical protein